MLLFDENTALEISLNLFVWLKYIMADSFFFFFFYTSSCMTEMWFSVKGACRCSTMAIDTEEKWVVGYNLCRIVL